MNYSILSLGSNVNNRERSILSAIKSLSYIGKILKFSSIYESEPFGYSEQGLFLNQNILLMTSLSAFELLAEVQKIENIMGRKRLFRFSPRIIDIDILVFNDCEINSENLIIPHSSLYKRKFFVLPLLEIVSEFGFFNIHLEKIQFIDKNIWIYKVL